MSNALRVAIDSRPLAGAGRVEDTINLLGHAASAIVRAVSKITDREPEDICRKAGIPLLLSSSIKAGLDIVGHPAGPTRAPLLPLTAEQIDRFTGILTAAGQVSRG